MADKETKKTWRVVEFEVDARQEELSGWLMMQQGANGCEVFPADDGQVRMRATFELHALPDGDLTRITAALDEYGLNRSIASLRTNELQEEDWLSKWKEGFEPFTVGDAILISPPWHQAKLTEDLTRGRAVVLIEPGLAFGTGFHETTRFCLLALQDYVRSAQHIVDVGSGSGILSIAAALLNKTTEIIAVENDPVACKNAGENFALNKVVDRIRMLEGTTDMLLAENGMAGRFDVVFANLTYEDHVALIEDYVRLMQPGAYILFAGILKEKGELMDALLAKNGLSTVRRDVGKAWVGFVAQK